MLINLHFQFKQKVIELFPCLDLIMRENSAWNIQFIVQRLESRTGEQWILQMLGECRPRFCQISTNEEPAITNNEMWSNSLFSYHLMNQRSCTGECINHHFIQSHQRSKLKKITSCISCRYKISRMTSARNTVKINFNSCNLVCLLIMDVSEDKLWGEAKQNNLPPKCGQPMTQVINRIQNKKIIS
jgi:hypothetical protein